MYLELKLSKPTDPSRRREVKINVVQTKEEAMASEEKGWSHLMCQTPIPVQLFMGDDPENRTVCAEATCNGTPLKAYFLPKAPKALMKRPLPRKTALKIPSHGETSLGFINPRETPLLESWWAKSKNEFLQKPLGKKATAPAGPQPAPTFDSIGRSNNLQVAKTPEVKTSLSRRRGISDFD